jgi:hypothetical protein
MTQGVNNITILDNDSNAEKVSQMVTTDNTKIIIKCSLRFYIVVTNSLFHWR